MVQDYRSSQGGRLALEVFEMESPASAYGMFTFKKSPRGEKAALGDEGQSADYYLNFYKGRFLVTVTSLDRGGSAMAGLLSLARALDARIKDRSQALPSLIGLFPEEGLLPESLLYLRGPLAVFNHESTLAPAAAGIESGAMGRYASGLTIAIFAYPSRDLARARLAETRAGLASDRGAAGSTGDGSILSAEDKRGRSILARVEGEFAVFVLGGTKLTEAEAELAQVVEKIKTPARRR